MHLLTVTISVSGAPQLRHAGLYTATREMSQALQSAGATVSELVLGDSRKSDLVGQPITAHQASLALGSGEVTAIYSQYVQAGLPFDLAAMAGPRVVPVVGFSHDLVNAMDPLLAWSGSPARHAADLAVVSSKAGERVLRSMLALAGSGSRFPRASVEVLPLGTTQPHFPGDRSQARRAMDWQEEEVVLLWLGRFSRSYKADLRPLLLAVRSLIDDRLPVRLVGVGADTDGFVDDLRRWSHALGIASKCTWVPNAGSDERDLLLAASDIFVNTSDHIQETFGLANLEAMANGLPVVASEWSGFREIVQDGETGFLIPTWLSHRLLDTPELDTFGSFSGAVAIDMTALVQRLKELVCDHSLRLRMGRLGAQRVAREYSWDTLAGRYLALFEKRVALARVSGPRNSSRPWLSEVFAHFSTNTFEHGSPMDTGPVSLETALNVVDDDTLRAEMTRQADAEQSEECGALEGFAEMQLLKYGVRSLGASKRR